MGIPPILDLVVGILLVAVLEVDRLLADRPRDRLVLDEIDVVRSESLHVLVVSREFVVVIARQQRDRNILAGRTELFEQLRIRFFEHVELLDTLGLRKLPEPERVTVDDQLGVLVSCLQALEKRE